MNASIKRECWCGSQRAQAVGIFQLDDGNAFQLVHCEGCGVFALFPPPNDEQLHSYYSSEYYGPSRRKFIGPVASIVSYFQSGRARMASRFLSAGAKVLDIGCGNGGFLMQMKQRGFQVEGTEWTAQSAARVPGNARIPVHVGDLLALDLPEQSYDLITLWHVFEHVRQPHEMSLRIKQLLKPRGMLMLSLPNAESRQAAKFGVDWFHHDPPRHLFGFGAQSLSRLLQMTGFEIKSINHFSLEQNPFGFIQSWLNARGYPRDRLFSLLKGQSRQSIGRRALDLLWLMVLAPPALVISTMESIAGRGATMMIVAQSV